MDSQGKKTGGRKPGQTNKLTRDIKSMIEAALDKVGGVKYLVKQANDNPTAFLNLLGRILPKDVTADIKVTGEFTLVDLLTSVDKRAPISPPSPKPH